ncbi:MAG: hypothetical protein AAGJ86_05555 [Pseudomonadota bacterium]
MSNRISFTTVVPVATPVVRSVLTNLASWPTWDCTVQSVNLSSETTGKFLSRNGKHVLFQAEFSELDPVVRVRERWPLMSTQRCYQLYRCNERTMVDLTLTFQSHFPDALSRLYVGYQAGFFEAALRGLVKTCLLVEKKNERANEKTV